MLWSGICTGMQDMEVHVGVFLLNSDELRLVIILTIEIIQR